MGEIQSGKKTKESNKAIHHHPKCEAKCGLTVTKIKKYKEKKLMTLDTKNISKTK